MTFACSRNRGYRQSRGPILIALFLTFAGRLDAQLIVDLRYSPHEEDEDAKNPVASGFGSVRPTPVKLTFSRNGLASAGSELMGEVGLKTVKTPVYAAKGVTAFLTEGASKQFAEWGFPVANEAPLSLDGAVVKCFVEEAYAYEAQIVILYTLRDAAGQVLWEGEIKSQERNFGLPQKPANYREVLSDALRENLRSLLSMDAFRAACTPREPSRSGTVEMTPEALKAEILKLMREGLEDDLLVAFASQARVYPSFTSDDLLAWKNAGISGKVLAAAMTAARGSATQ